MKLIGASGCHSPVLPTLPRALFFAPVSMLGPLPFLMRTGTAGLPSPTVIWRGIQVGVAVGPTEVGVRVGVRVRVGVKVFVEPGTGVWVRVFVGGGGTCVFVAVGTLCVGVAVGRTWQLG